MATLLTRAWTAADGTSWEAVGFLRVVGAAFDATILSNTGRCGATATQRVFMVTGYPGTPGHKVAVDMDWSNAAGASRAPGVGVRWTDDGQDGYIGEVDSNTGAARVRIRRRRAGVWTDLTGWVDISGSVSAAALNAGVTVELRAVNGVDQVELSLRVSGVERTSFDDTSADRVESSGSPAILIDGNSTGADVAYDSLTVRDLEDEYTGDPADLAAGIALVVDGVSYSWDDLVEAGIVVGRGRQSYDQGDGWEFRSKALMDEADGILYPGAVVKVALDGVIVAHGRIQASSRKIAPGEGRGYQLVCARRMAADVVLEHPDTGAETIVWNLPEDHADYDADYAGKTIGEAIATILDWHADGSTGLRAHLAAPPDEDTAPYVQAELDLLTAKLPGMQGGQDPVSAVEELLSRTKYLLFIDPDTLIWHVKDRTAGTIRTVSLSADHVLGEYSVDPLRNSTAALVVGSRPETQTVTLDNSIGGGLEADWPSALEATRDDETSQKNRDTGLVASIGGSIGTPTMTPDTVGPPAFSMAADEWTRCVVGFSTGAEAGEVYDVVSNSGLAFALEGPWRNGGPAAGDEFTVSGNAAGGGRDNAYTEIGKRWKLTNTDLGIPDDACLTVKVFQDNILKYTTAKVLTPDDPAEAAQLVLDLPAIGLVNFGGTAPSPCDAAGANDVATVEVELLTFSRSDPSVPTLWVPTSLGAGAGVRGYTGSAFAADPAKYAGGGTPGRGDPARMAVLRFPAPEYDGSAGQIAEWEAALLEVLSFTGALARSVVLNVQGILDTDYAGLGCRLQVSGGPPELGTTTEMTVLAVEWDVPGNKTTIYAGTLSAGEYDPQRMREGIVARSARRTSKREQQDAQRLLDCLDKNVHSGGYVGELPPVQICADRVTLPGGGRVGETLNQECEPPDGGCVQACDDFPCETVPPADATNFSANATLLLANNPKTRDSAAHIAYLKAHVACIWDILGGIASSHDQELHKTNQDLASVRTNLDALVACINAKVEALCDAITAVDARLTLVQTCFNAQLALKVTGVGAAGTCDVDPAPCTVVANCAHNFTETVCEDACSQAVPLMPAYTGCVAP